MFTSCTPNLLNLFCRSLKFEFPTLANLRALCSRGCNLMFVCQSVRRRQICLISRRFRHDCKESYSGGLDEQCKSTGPLTPNVNSCADGSQKTNKVRFAPCVVGFPLFRRRLSVESNVTSNSSFQTCSSPLSQQQTPRNKTSMKNQISNVLLTRRRILQITP